MTTPRRRAGILLSALPVLFLIFDAAIKLAEIAPVAEAFARMGFPPGLAQVIGGLELCCLVLYLVPRWSILGAVLLTGFLGGAVALHARIGDPLPSHTLFPIYVGAMLWLGLGLRDARVQAMFASPQR
jgi:hypothetical protein